MYQLKNHVKARYERQPITKTDIFEAGCNMELVRSDLVY